MDTDNRKLSPEELARLESIKFEEYLRITRWLIVALAILIILLWTWDLTFDPVNARDTIKLRLAASAATLLGAVLINRKTGITASAVVLYVTMLFIQAIYTQILAIMTGGFLIGIGGYLYFYLSILLLGLPFSFRANAAGTLFITFAPHLWGILVDPAFPHMLYVTLIWPAGIICIFFHWSTGNMILDRLHYRSRMEDLALEDPLTGLQNRRGLERDYRKVRSLAQRENEDLSLILLDIDHFKAINDRHGHLAGDRVLEKLAGIMKNDFRASDSLARIGGEEFVCLMPDTDMEGALAKAEGLRRAAEQARVTTTATNNKTIGFTISLGVALARPTENFEDTLRRADEALYRAKSEGRNRIAQAA